MDGLFLILSIEITFIRFTIGSTVSERINVHIDTVFSNFVSTMAEIKLHLNETFCVYGNGSVYVLFLPI